MRGRFRQSPNREGPPAKRERQENPAQGKIRPSRVWRGYIRVPLFFDHDKARYH